MDSVAIRIQGVSHVYTDSQRTHALKDISLTLCKGEVVSVVGQSGCGKTTLLKITAGLIDPTEGDVEIAGFPVREARALRKYGMVFQNPVLFPWRSVGDNILLPLELRAAKLNKPTADLTTPIKEQALETASLVGLSGFWNAHPSQLSGGMQARVAIARALSFRPQVMLMDEPFGSLDEITRTKLNEHLLTLQARTQLTMLIVTHSLREAAFLSDRVVVLTARPGEVQSIMNVPHRNDRLAWRETGEFSRFCMDLRNALGE